MAEIEVGDVVLIRSLQGGRTWAVVQAVRLGRLRVERCDGRPSGPIPVRDVVTVFKEAGAPSVPPLTPRMRPTAQMKLDV